MRKRFSESMLSHRRRFLLAAAVVVFAGPLALTGCNRSSSTSPEKEWDCVLPDGGTPDFSRELGCREDYDALASEPLDASIPGALSLKTVVDLADGAALYFQNSKEYPIHWEFASAHLSGGDLPIVPPLSGFNQTEYYSPDRRFILGALTFYEGPGVWAYELSPYDNASAEMIALAYEKVAEACYCGDDLAFHPTSLAIEAEAKKLPASVRILTTDDLYAGIDYQPLNYGSSIGRLVFLTAKELEDTYVGFRDIVVLDAVPNDISVVNGIITQEFQTPLSHINVLSRNRGTPNMGLRGAYENEALRALEGKWVKLTVAPFTYTAVEATQEEADAWWEDNRPASVGVPNMDTTQRELLPVREILDIDGLGLDAALDKAIPAYGGKTSHFAAFPHMDSTQIKHQGDWAFGVPVYYYWQHMERNGLNDTLEQMLADPEFQSDPAVRDRRLESLREAIIHSPVDTAFERALLERIDEMLPGIERVRFRSSTNAEDLDGFTGAGLYDSRTGGRHDAGDPIREAYLEVWASVWYFRAYEERSYRNIDHKSVGMALLVHPAHPEEEANGVAITANIFDKAGVEPGFYVNVQVGGESVVQPATGITTDQFLYHYDMPGQPVVYIARSNLIPGGTGTVLTPVQTHALGKALAEIHRFFRPVYGKTPGAWFAMDTEFKLDQLPGDPDGEPVIIMKQARPYPAWEDP